MPHVKVFTKYLHVIHAGLFLLRLQPSELRQLASLLNKQLSHPSLHRNLYYIIHVSEKHCECISVRARYTFLVQYGILYELHVVVVLCYFRRK